MAYVFRQGDLPKLDLQVDRGTDFKAWRSQWDAYLSLSGLDTQPAAKQVQALTLCFSRETVTIVNNLGLTETQRGNASEIVQAIQQYIEGQVNESVERRNFRQRSQQPGESFDDFLVSLRELAKTCKFCSEECLEKNIRDQIIEGLLEGDTVEVLLREKDLTLATAISKCRAQEAARKQRVEMTTSSSSLQINVMRRQPDRTTPPPSSRTCPGCGGGLHLGGRQQCPAFRRVCHTCKKVGHLARVCRGRKGPPNTTRPPSYNEPAAQAVYVESPSEEPPSQVNASKVTGHLNYTPAPTIEVHISSLNGSSMVHALPDSGADISVAGAEVLDMLNEHPDNLLYSDIMPRAVNGARMHPIGKIPVSITLGRVKYEDELHIYPEVRGTRVLLSWTVAKGLKILPDCYPHPPLSADEAQIASIDNSPLQEAATIISEFPSVFDGKIKTMEGEKFHITLMEGAKPFCVRAPRAIPFAFRDKLKDELELLQSQGIIAPVTEPTEWCAPIVVTPKKDSDKIRMCVDLSHLNKYVKRERYQSTTPAQAVADIVAADARVFTKMDALKGYHQCPLDDESQLLTTFITPYGRFKFLRALYGISSISEHYDRRMDEAFSGLTGYRCIVDDVIIYDSNEADHASHVREFLQRCSDRRITLNKDKWVFCQHTVSFAGFTLSPDGYCVDTSITEAISEFPIPVNRTDLRSFVGLVNQLSASTPTIAGLLAPLQPLLSTKNEFVWSPDLDKAFDRVKQSLISAPVLSYFDPSKPTRLCTDASRQGLGFVLQQQSGDSWVLVQAGSRFLSDSESRYAIIELELLAVAWAVIKCKLFLTGLPQFKVITDHHPLVPILNNHRLDEIENPRLQRLKTKIMAYNFVAEWVKGTLNYAPDALSRNPVSDPKPHEMLAERDGNDSVGATIAEVRAMSAGPQESLRLQELRRHASEDHEYQLLRHYITDGFPEHRSQLPEECRRYWNVRSHLALDDGLITYGCRLLVPSAMRRDILAQLHESHQGSVRTKQRAQLVVYWPGLDNDIDNIIMSCQQCQERLPSHPKEPIVLKPKPDRPLQEIAVDFCSYAGHDFLITVDCYTDWPDVVHMGNNTTTPRLVTALKRAFCQSGAPDIVWSDQGPQFTSKMFQDFSREWGFTHLTSSPMYPQSNGKVEATVKSMKKLIQAAWTGRLLDEGKLARSLMQYRNTPSRKDGLSPAQKLYGHPIQDTLPAHRRAFASEWQRSAEEAERKAVTHAEQVELYYNQHAQPLPEINVGSKVAMQNPTTKCWDIYGVVTNIGPHRRYWVKTAGGRVLTRNRRFLRRRVPVFSPETGLTNPMHLHTNPEAPPVTVPTIPVQPPAPLRRLTRCCSQPKRLIEEITFK